MNSKIRPIFGTLAENRGISVWFSDTVAPSIHGETLKQACTLSDEPSYSYDAVGRLTQVQEIPVGEGCKTRVYVYDADGNRTSEASREPGAEGSTGGPWCCCCTT
jgi:uncharacterized protein RhaS with RHS repeats